MALVPGGVTVVIPTHNRWLMLRSALWSALNQDGVDTRAVVVDDGSRDETPERLAGIEHEALTVLRVPEAGGVSAARNRGLEHVETEWVAFLDDDDVWAPHHLARLLQAVGDRDVDLAYSGHVATTREREVEQLFEPPDPEEVPQGMFSANLLTTPSRVLLRTQAARAAGGFDTDLSIVADWDFWLRVIDGRPVAASTALSVGYMRHEGNMHKAVADTIDEIARLDQRYESQRPADAPSPMDGCSRWIANSFRAAGDRRRAARWYLRAYRQERNPRNLGRAAGVLLGERAIELSGLKKWPEVPADAAPWLDRIRQIDQLPPDEAPFS